MSDTDFDDNSADIAIIGMAGRFPGAESVEQLWENIADGIESISDLDEQDLIHCGVDPALLLDPAYIPRAGIISDGECFDAEFFGYLPSEAQQMDPQHRLFLECGWSVLENAGYCPDNYEGIIAVYGGVGRNSYFTENLATHPDLLRGSAEFQGFIGNEKDYPVTRLSYKLNLRGPAVSVQTACSTSGTAVHLACQSLLSGESDIALAGGCRLLVPTRAGYFYVEGGALSQDGHSRAFDARASGMVRGSGVAFVALKRLEDAIEDGDNIYSIIKSTAINNDGNAKAGFTAPSIEGQSGVIKMALDLAGVSADEIAYVETHGTGTPVGDPIEFRALRESYSPAVSEGKHCALGAIKNNIGHLDAAAGLVGMIKVTQALVHKKKPPLINYSESNPQLELNDSPFYIPTEIEDWEEESFPRRGAVSSFGLGGTNFHTILEEYHAQLSSVSHRKQHILVLSARTASSLKQASLKLITFLEANPDVNLADVAYTLQCGRRAFSKRRAVACGTVAEALTGLKESFPRITGEAVGSEKLVYLLPGGGAQYVNMARDLYDREPEFTRLVDKGLLRLQEASDKDVRAIWLGQTPELLSQPSIQLPLIFLVEYALAQQLMGWGLKPAALIGHSMGENTAACIAGVMSFDDTLKLIITRGELLERAGSGKMLSIPMPVDEIGDLLGDTLDIAVINNEQICVVSGPDEQIVKLQEVLESKEIEAQLLSISTAAHSRLLDPVLEDFRACVASLDLSPAKIPLISNRTGTWMTDEQATSVDYWVEQLRHTVLFSDGVSTLLGSGHSSFVEVGPGKTLSSLVNMQAAAQDKNVVAVPSMRHAEERLPDQQALLQCVGNIWCAGITPDWSHYYAGENRRRVALPGYYFERKRYWLDPLPLPGQTDSGLLDGNVLQQISSGVAGTEEYLNGAEGDPGDCLAASRKDLLVRLLRGIIHEMSGIELDEIHPGVTFLNMGFDSLFLTQANLRFKKEFKVKISFRQLFDEAPCIDALAEYIDSQLPGDVQQQQLIAQASSLSPRKVTAVESSHMPGITEQAAIVGSQSAAELAQQQVSQPQTERFGPYKAIQKSIGGEFTPGQLAYLQDFMKRYEQRTAKSKLFTEQHRPHFADPRALTGFKMLNKEITYPIVEARSKGARLWDIDGNEYVDCSGGFGAGFFGQSPDFVLDAVRQQMDVSINYSPQSTIAAPTAKLLCDMTGMDRASFCNTGSEAVLAAVRIARTVTGNDLLVTFSGDYHGIFDEMLVRVHESGGQRRNIPVAPGIPVDASRNVLVLDYGDPASLQIIRQRAGELAGVLVEPIQSRRPELQPVEFLQQLQALTQEVDIPLIFDEIITGFRLHPKGAQAWFGVEADIAAYGKVIGGGLPIGAVAGRSKYMDALDGGQWQYGDDSFPEVGITYFAGTFVRHPMAMAAAQAVLEKLKAEGPQLQRELNRITAVSAEKINRSYRQMNIPIHISYFGSVILPRFNGSADFESIFYQHLRYNGLHIWEGRPGFMTVTHGEYELQFIIDNFVTAAEQMRDAGFFPAALDPPVDKFPWTPPQSELWLGLKMGREAIAAYNEQVVLQVDSDIDAEVLELSLDKAVNRHPGLRAVVQDNEQGLAVQHYMMPAFKCVDFSQSGIQGLDERVQTLLREHVDADFDFQQGPLIRLTLFKLPAGKSIFCLCSSHLVCDGWSLEIVLKDITRFYTAIIQGRQIDRPTPPTLADLLAIERERERSGELQEAREFWLNLYSDIPDYLELPLDSPRPPLKTYRGERHAVKIDSGLAGHLRDYARQQNSTLFIVLLGCFNILLAKLTGQADLVVGVPAAGHPNMGLPDLVAHNVNFLPLRSKLNQQLCFDEFLVQLRNEFADAKNHQDFSYGALIQALSLPRDPARMPLVSTGFNMDLVTAPLWFEACQAKPLTTPRSYVKYDLFFNLVDDGEGLLLQLDHNSDIISAESALAWAEFYKGLLADIIGEPTKAITELSLLDVESRECIATRWNDTDRDYPLENSSLVSLFRDAVKKSPDATALVMEGEALSYLELDRRSNQLAQYLRKLDIGKDDIVGIVMHRSLEMVISLYAVLKAGAAYVPLDPDFPIDRLDFILKDAAVKQVLADDSCRDKLPSDANVTVVDNQWQDIAANSDKAPEVTIAPGDLAYIIYTSGSTGEPKGVMVEHISICNHNLWMAEHFNFGANDRVLQKTPYSFDVSLWEFFVPLMSGSQLILAVPDGHKDTQYLVNTIEEYSITHIHFVASMLSLFLSSEDLDHCQSLRCIITSGEAVSRELEKKYKKLFPEIALWNLYGPTEAAVHVSSWQCALGDSVGSVPIGKPIANTRLYIVDDAMQIQPVGAAGELLIGGTQVARGYINRDALTRERFVPDPFSDSPESYLYKTGDLCRYRTSGDIEYLGRNDFQVKLRGLRIELGEIEAALEAHTDIDQAVVVAREYRENDTRLIAYICFSSGRQLNNSEVRRFLRGVLPAYMIPQFFVELEEIPLTASGKIDRKSLPEAFHAVTPEQDVLAPRSDVEKQLVALWKEILQLERVGIDDHFFDLGGHSLLALDLISRVKALYAISFSLVDILTVSLEQMAVNIEQYTDRMEEDARDTVVANKKGGLLRRLLKR